MVASISEALLIFTTFLNPLLYIEENHKVAKLLRRISSKDGHFSQIRSSQDILFPCSLQNLPQGSHVFGGLMGTTSMGEEPMPDRIGIDS